MKSLKVLQVRHNYIKDVDEEAFGGLEQLRRIRVSSNKIPHLIKLSSSLKLRLFAMMTNFVPVIGRNSFGNFKFLTQINISLNKIEKIDEFAMNLPLLVNLDLMGNRINKFISANVFYGLKSLKELILGNNSLSELFPFTLSHLNNLSTLNLDANQIEQIQNDSFYGLTKLKKLSLRYNLLKRLNSSIFWHLSNLAVLELDSNRLTSISKGSFLGMNNLAILRLSDNRLQFIKTTFFVSLKNLNELYLRNNQISSIQVESFDSLSNLSLLDLKDNNIFTIDPRLFFSMKSLVKLFLQMNVIHSIYNQTFVYLANLVELDLSYNQLTVLKPGILSPLKKLKWLNVEQNPISTIYFECFVDLSNLVYLNFGNDAKLFNIVPHSARKEQLLPKLESLIFKNDNAFFIGQFTFSNKQLVSLYLCEINFNISKQLMLHDIKKIYMQKLEIAPRSLNYYFTEFGESLLELDLSYNLIEFKRPNQFISRAKHLQKLWMVGVNITNFDVALNLTNFSKLLLLDLSCNRLEVIRAHYFKFNYELINLNLSHNKIRNLEDYSLFHNSKMVVLDMSFNLIESLTNDVFPVAFCYLKQFILNDNKLSTFSGEYRFLSKFELIRLDNNNLTRFPKAIYLTVNYVDDLNLSGNRISRLTPSFFSQTNRIAYLYFRNCSINIIESESFKKLHILIILDLSVNNLINLESYVLSDLRRLQIINIGSNQISFIQNELFQGLKRLTNVYLNNNLIYDVDNMAFMDLFNLKIINLDLNPVVNLFKDHTFIGLIQLKHMYVSNLVNLSLEIVQSIRRQIKTRLVREVLHMKFYDSIEINFPPNYDKVYTPHDCYYITYLIRNKISLNLENETCVTKYVFNCKDWSTYMYNEKLENIVDAVFA